MSLLDTLAVDSSARLHGTPVGDPLQAGFQIVQSFPNIHADYADTIVVAKRVRKVVNPTADKQTYSGQFIVNDVQAIEQGGQDASFRKVEVRRTLTKFKPITDTGIDTGSWVPMTQKETYNLFGINEGTHDVDGRQWRHLDNTDTAADSAMNVSLDTSPANMREQRRIFQVGNDNMGSLSVLYRKVTWRS